MSLTSLPRYSLRNSIKSIAWSRSLATTASGFSPSTASSPSAPRCIITGASRGIGKAIAQRFAADGMSCTLVARNEAMLEDVMISLPKASAQGEALAHRVKPGDVANRNFWEALAKQEKDVSVLVNAAGLTHYSLLLTTQKALVEQVVQTNLMGTVWACQIMVKNMVRKKEGCIINISSLLGAKGGRGSTVYAASKAGIIGLSQALAAEVGQTGIRVNTILPGYIESPMTDNMTPEARNQALNAIPLQRFGRADEVADAAAFLARNLYANNCTLNLDGGLSAM